MVLTLPEDEDLIRAINAHQSDQESITKADTSNLTTSTSKYPSAEQGAEAELDAGDTLDALEEQRVNRPEADPCTKI